MAVYSKWCVAVFPERTGTNVLLQKELYLQVPSNVAVHSGCSC